jgi:hexulose-6-phosphate isomerase
MLLIFQASLEGFSMAHSIHRRDFLKMGGGAVALASLTTVGSLTADSPTKKHAIKKAIMYLTIGFPGSVMEKLKAVKAAGFEGVEPMSHMKQEEVLKALEETGLKAASVCCATHWDKPLSSPDENVRREGVEGLLQALKDAQRYGASSVLLVPGRVTKQVSYDDCWQRSIPEIRKAIPTAEKLGVKIAIENVWNEFITKVDQATDYLEAIDSPLVGWHFDIGNVVRFSPPETWIPVLGKRILKLHVKEWGKLKPNNGFGVRFFEGDNRWPAIMKALDNVGYQGWGITEQPGEQSKDADLMRDLSNRFDKILAS